jgi:hemerythrin
MSINFVWTKDLSVGEDHIDEQHKRLLSQVNKIIHIMTFGATSKEITETLYFFDEYINEHFIYEEDYMKKNKYPYIDEHKKKHKDFIKSYLLFKKQLYGGVKPERLIMDIETYLGQWWINHIGKEDKKYHDFISRAVWGL